MPTETLSSALPQESYVDGPDTRTTPGLVKTDTETPKNLYENRGDVFGSLDFPKSRTDFHNIPQETEPHMLRRRAILQKYPEIQKLMVKEPITALIWLAIGPANIAVAYYAQNFSWPAYIVCLYVISASINHTMQILIHDLTHYTAFDSLTLNRIVAILCNIPTGVPSAIAFGKYHADHHQYMGIPGKDADLPSKIEIKLINSNIFFKLFFVVFQCLFYAIRPLITVPKTPTPWELVNLVVVFFTDYLIVTYLGWGAMVYLLVSSLVSMGLHPLAMHTIAEHYEFVQGQETYDYFGSANIFNLNLGYHTEHHDFPMIPWRHLSKIRKIAPEFYTHLPYHTSYWKVAWNYITSSHIGPFSRIDASQVDKKTE